MSDQEHINKIISELKKNSEIKECFYHKKEECKGDIKNAHSISRANRLDLIKGLINKNDVVVSLSEIVVENGVFKKGVDNVGWGKVASTFYGFCDWHDSTLFEPIENGNNFDESNEHCFLHSYRSFAYTFHYVKKTYKLVNYTMDSVVDKFNYISLLDITSNMKALKKKADETPFPNEDQKNNFNAIHKHTEQLTEQLNSLLKSYNSIVTDAKEKLSYSQEELDAKQLQSSVKWLEKYKLNIDYAIENKSYDRLKYYCRIKDNLLPFAAAFAFSPDFIYSEESSVIIPPNDGDILNTCLMVTILPDKSNKTIILFSCFDGDKQSQYFLNKLFSMTNEVEFEKAVSSIVIKHSTNVFLSPTMWEKLGDRQKILMDEANMDRPFDDVPKKPFMSKINLFDKEFAV